jgi:hypothetical protein
MRQPEAKAAAAVNSRFDARVETMVFILQALATTHAH